MDQNRLDHDEIEKDIQKSIEEIKSRDEKPWPEKTYRELDNKKITPLTSAQTEYEKRRKKDKITIALLAFLTFVMMVVSSILLVQSNTIANYSLSATNKPQIIKTGNGSQMINNIEFKVESAQRTADGTEINLNVSNKSENNFYVTIRSISLVDEQGHEYLPNLDKGNIPVKFFGEKILPSTNNSATIVFDGVPNTTKKLTLVVSNVSDLYHFTWDYMITLP